MFFLKLENTCTLTQWGHDNRKILGFLFSSTSCILLIGPIIVLPCKSLTQSVSNAFAPNQVQVYPIFIKVVTIVCQSWYMDLSKFLNAFFTVITGIPCRLTNQTKVVFESFASFVDLKWLCGLKTLHLVIWFGQQLSVWQCTASFESYIFLSDPSPIIAMHWLPLSVSDWIQNWLTPV